MVSSRAATVEAYLEELPEERRAVVTAMREVILQHLPAGYQETMNWGMISYEIPLKRYPKTYNGQPLSYAGLAAQKNHFALYLLGVYMNPAAQEWLRAEFQKAGKKLDMGKACVRFRKLADLPLEVRGQAVAKVPPEELIAWNEKVHPLRG
ncbi:MAG TPA: DUF1801 domain-containing protein [Thermoanaerobaculia bacterium]|nr:DUF1801 domain-containing protein [Thermoanaerobaculia bacterium]